MRVRLSGKDVELLGSVIPVFLRMQTRSVSAVGVGGLCIRGMHCLQAFELKEMIHDDDH